MSKTWISNQALVACAGLLIWVLPWPGILSAATVSGVVRFGDEPVANTYVYADDPSFACVFCSSVAGTRTDEDGVFSFTLPDGEYVIHTQPAPPLTPAWQRVLLTGGDVTDLNLGVDEVRNPYFPDSPPDASLIHIDVPNASHMTQITGSPGAVIGGSRLVFINLDTGHIAHTQADENGGFTTSMTGFPGTSLMIKSDQYGYHAASYKQRTPTDRTGGSSISTVIPGTILRIPSNTGANAIGAGLPFDPYEFGDFTPPVWSFEGNLSPNSFDPGDSVRLQGEIRLHSPVLDGVESVSCDMQLKLERISGLDGQSAMGRNMYASSLMTPTGLPIEHESQLVDSPLDGYTAFTFQSAGQAEMSSEIDISLPLPQSISEGYYRPYFRLCWPDIPVEQPPLQYMVVLESGTEEERRLDLPLIRVGNPAQPRLFLTLLTDSPSNGSRGIVANEDRGKLGLSPRTMIVSRDHVLPKTDVAGNPITYRLEPFAQQISSGDRVPPRAPKIPFRFPSGHLKVTIEEPDGQNRIIGPAPFTQSRLKSLTDYWGNVILAGGGNITDLYQLSTMDSDFDVTFDQYGLHRITLEAEIEDIWGTSYSGGGTYELYIARPLILNTAVLPGTPFEVGDSFMAGLTVSPAVPAQVKAELTLAANSNPDNLVRSAIRGRTNDFGLFMPGDQSPVLDLPGEYRYDVSASWTDNEGTLWMGSRTFAGVVAPKNSSITAHGRRGIDTEPQIGQAWYTREAVGNGPGGHINQPFFTGDIAWVTNGDALTTTLSFDEQGNQLANLLASRMNCCTLQDGPGSLEERATVGELPLFSGHPDGLDLHFDPEGVDLWAYSYRSIQRPLVRVREFISEDFTDSPYWRFEEQYAGQAGMGVGGDWPNDMKFQYGGVVLRGDALEEPRYAIYGSLAVIVADDDPFGGSRVMPPFQGNGGGPTGGPIIQHKGEDIDLLINLRSMRPGSIYRVGERFSLTGAVAPTLPVQVGYTVTRPDGAKVSFPANADRTANPVGYYYQPNDDFELDQAGLWQVDIQVTYAGQTSAGPVTKPYPTGNLLGSDNGRIFFYVVDNDPPAFAINLPTESGFPSYWGPGGLYSEIDISADLPDGLTPKRAHVTTMMPGTLLEFRELDSSLTYHLDINALAADAPNLDSTIGLFDILTTTLYVEAQDEEGQTHHMGRVINLNGDRVFALEPERPFSINAGVNDAWVHEGATNQGIFLTAFTELDLMFAAWFTFDSVPPDGEATAVVGAPDQRWITALGPISGASASLTAELTTGGRFNSTGGDPQQDPNYGTIQIDFANCASAEVSYDFPSASENGNFTMNRVLPENTAVCEGIIDGTIDPSAAAQQLERFGGAKVESEHFVINPGMNDAWVNPDASFQGMFLTVFPEFQLMFAAWFVFDTEPQEGAVATVGAPDQRWLTALGSYSGSQASLEIENTTGGIFESDSPKPVQDPGYGTLEIDFSDCSNAQVTFDIPDAQQSGTFSLQRVLGDNDGLCEVLGN